MEHGKHDRPKEIFARQTVVLELSSTWKFFARWETRLCRMVFTRRYNEALQEINARDKITFQRIQTWNGLRGEFRPADGTCLFINSVNCRPMPASIFMT